MLATELSTSPAQGPQQGDFYESSDADGDLVPTLKDYRWSSFQGVKSSNKTEWGFMIGTATIPTGRGFSAPLKSDIEFYRRKIAPLMVQ